MQPNTKYLIPQILIIESGQEGWIEDEDGVGGVDFLPREVADQIIDSGLFPDGVFEKCKAVGAGYEYKPEQEILTQKDIENLEWASGGFHDACIQECKLQDDGSLYVKFVVLGVARSKCGSGEMLSMIFQAEIQMNAILIGTAQQLLSGMTLFTLLTKRI